MMKRTDRNREAAPCSQPKREALQHGTTLPAMLLQLETARSDSDQIPSTLGSFGNSY